MIKRSRWKVSPVSRDLLIVLVLTALAILIEWRFDLIDRPLAAIRQGHAEIVDEVLQIAALLGIALVGFAWRQWRTIVRENRERERAEQALRRSEEQYRALFASAHEPMLIFRPADEVILAANERAAELYGIPRDGLIGRSLQAFSTDRERGSQSVHDMLAHADTMPRRTFSFVQRRPDGTRLDIVAQASVVTYEGETAILTINRDVTEQKRAEELLQRQNAYYAALHETSLGLLHQLDLTAVLEGVVARAASLVGTAHGYVELVTDEGERLETVVSIGMCRAYQGTCKRRGEGVGGVVWQTGQPLVVNEYDTWSGRLPGDERAGCHAVVGIPLMSGDTVVGVLGIIATETGRTFGAEEVELLTRFAALAAIALHNARLHTAAQRELEERRRAEAQLRANETRFRALVEQSSDAIALLDGDGIFLYASASTRRVCGYDADELLGRDSRDFTHRDDDVTIRKALVGFREQPGATARAELRMRHEDGRWHWMEVVYTNLLDEPAVQAVVINYRDITARREVEAALRESEERYRLMFESNPRPMWVYDRETLAFLSVNDAAVAHYGYARDEFLSMTIEDIRPPEDVAHLLDDLLIGQGTLEAGRPVRHRKKDGTIINVEISSHDLDLDRRQTRLVLATDVTERVRAEDALRESEERYRLMFDSNPLPMWVYDAETLAFLAVNDAAVTHYGYSREEFLAMTIEDVRPPEDVPILLASLAQGVPPLSHPGIRRHRTKDGTLIDVDITLYTMPFGERQARLTLANDVTDRLRAERQVRESEERYRTLIERSPEPIVVHDQERYIFANAAALKLLGAARSEQVIGKSVYSFIHPTFRDLAQSRIRTSYTERASSGITELTMLRVDGEAVEVETDNMPITYHDRPATLVIFHDITARKQAERQLRESEERYRLMFESNPLPMWVYDVETLRFRAVNDAAIGHYGYSREEFLAMTTPDIRPPEAVPALRAFLAAHQDIYQPSGVWRHRKIDGTLVDMEITSYLLEFEGRAARLVVANDVTERQRAEEALRHHALHDALTGLPNRTLFAERLARALERTRRDPEYHFAVLYLDFDRFKTINDSLGHLEGDHVLIEGAQRLARCGRAQDTLARFGGDEFVLLLEELTDSDTPLQIADCLNQALATPIALGGQEVVITASIGIVFGAPDYHRPDELLRDADIAMYQAKALGKGEPVVFDTMMHARAVARLHLENDLRRAVEQAEFVLFYQPIVALTTGETTGFEALVRWQHPEIGLIAPAEFIPLAEETGLIVPLGQWVLREACQQLRQWDERCPAHAPVTVSVNVSARELRQPDFVAYVLSVVREAGLQPDRLVLEITESTLIEEAEAATLALRTLQRAGVRIQLDDFGMGYSSLSYLHRFPLDALKIDRSFVSAAGQSGIVNRAIVAAIVALAHTLRITVTAEGIETAEQQAALETLACEYGQGYHFSPPITAGRAVQLLQHEMARPKDTSRALIAP